MKKLLKWGAIIVVVLIVIGALAGSGDKSGSSSGSNSGTQANKQEEKVYGVNETIATEKLEVTVTNVEERAKVGSQYVNEKASEGATLIAISWKYKNTSDKPVGSFSQPSVKLVDSSGTEYDWDLGKSSSYAVEKELDSKVLSDLNPGITVNDAKVFEISKESYAKGGWSLVVKADGKSYIVKLN